MASTWQTARVFISSTFRDMHAERDHLVKVVFPELRERLLPHRIELIDIDLRWGITEEESRKDRVLDLCLELIDDCRPFFLGILGERYGWVPKTLSDAVKEKYGWVQHETGKSVTELEMLFGVLLIDPRMKGRSFFYFRDPKALDDVPEPARSEVYVETDPELIRKLAALKQKIRNVRDQGYPVFDGYPARWNQDATNRLAIDEKYKKGRLESLEAFGRRVKRDLWRGLCRRYPEIRRRRRLLLQRTQPEPAQVDPWAEERDIQERFIHSRLGVYVGRETLYHDLEIYADGSSKGPCLLTGPGGSGKSAALAKFVTDYQKSHDDVVVISHFIGASPRSASLRDTLERLCRELYERVLRTEHAARLASVPGTGEEAEKARQMIEQEYTIPQEIAPLVTTWRNFLKQIPMEHRAVIVLDALNQLEEADRARELWWLPHDFLSRVKVVVSAIVEPESQQADQDLLARAFVHRDKTHIRMEPLTDADRRAIIRQVPSIAAKTLSDSQVKAMLANPATDNPLYLRVAIEELRGFGSFEKLNDRIAALPAEGVSDETYTKGKFTPEAMRQAGDPVTALFTQVIQRLESDFSPPVVHDVLTLIASARRGLSERELQDLLADLPEADDLFPILRQLRPYLVNRNGLLGFFHGNLLQAVQRCYLATEDDCKAGHIRLAEFFEKQDPWRESLEEQGARSRWFPLTPRPTNVRRADELVWQWLEAKRWDNVSRTLLDLDFLEAKAEAGQVFDLVSDFTRAVERLPGNHSDRRNLRLISQAVGADIQSLARHHTTLFQCLWNRCWWYDCPAAAAHYDAPPGGWPAAGPPWSRPGDDRLATLLESWRAAKERRTPAFAWLRSLRPPPFPLGGAELACLRGHDDTVWSVAFDREGRRIVSGSRDNTVRVWDAASGAELACLRGHDDWVNTMAFDREGRRIVSGSEDDTVRVWDASSGAELACLRGHDGWVMSVAFDREGRRIVSGGGEFDKTVRVWDADSGAELACLRGHDDEVSSVAFDREGRRIVSGSDDNTVRVWDAASGAELACLRGHDLAVLSVAFDRDGRRIVSGSRDKTLRVWDTDSGAELACLRGHDDWVSSVAFDREGRRIVSGSDDDTVRVWDAASGAELACLRGHDGSVESVAIDREGRRIVSGSYDNTLRIWDAASGSELACLRGHGGLVSSVAFDRDGRRIVGGSYDNTVLVWDAASGAELACLRGHDGWVESVAFDPEGRRIVSGSFDDTVRVWDASSGAELACLRGHDGWVESVAFDREGRRIVSGSADKTVRVWDAASGTELACFRGHDLAVWSVSIDREGRRIVSGSHDKTVRVWDADSGAELACLRGHEGPVENVVFDHEGRRIISGSWIDKTVRVWDAATGDCLEVIQGFGDVAAIAAPASVFPWRAMSRNLETVIEPASGGEAVAWFPAALEHLATHPSGRIWAGTVNNHLCIIKLEGEPDPKPS
ncbi:MAG: DUF4062 domain-containing protein [Isosphaerales bacterium]